MAKTIKNIGSYGAIPIGKKIPMNKRAKANRAVNPRLIKLTGMNKTLRGVRR